MHLYDQSGKPVYDVPYSGKKKGTRPATLRDARKMSLVPSVTEIMRVMAAPGLEIWKQNQILDAAYSVGQYDFEGNDINKDVWLQEVKTKAGEIAKTAREEGSRIHDAIESAFKERVISPHYRKVAYKVRDYVQEQIAGGEWFAEESFAHQIGYGGKVDLVNYEKKIVVDFKTKEVIEEGQKLAWDNHIMQLPAYGRGLGFKNYIEDVKYYNLFVSWDGDIVLHEWSAEDARRGLQMFDACFDLFCLMKNFDPSF